MKKERRHSLLRLPKKIVILDLECTTWDGAAARNWSGPGEHREVVQLGAAIVKTANFEEVSSFSALMKPKINPVLSHYFVKLTGIKQRAVNKRGLDFTDALKLFHWWCRDYELYMFDSKVDGSRLFDRDVLMENCKLYGIEFPFKQERFHNINEIFYKHGYVVKQSGAAPEAFGLKITARPHNALNDVKGLIIGLRALSKRIGDG